LLEAWKLDPALFFFWVLAVEDGDVPEYARDLAMGLLGYLGSEFFLLTLEVVEAHLDEFAGLEGFVHGMDEGFRDALFAHEHDRV